MRGDTKVLYLLMSIAMLLLLGCFGGLEINGDGTGSDQQVADDGYARSGEEDAGIRERFFVDRDDEDGEHGLVERCPLPAADFTVKPASGTLPLTVQFVSLSRADEDFEIEGWYWDFGDGSKSTEQNPQHTYQQPGSYTVTLTVKNRCGTSSATRDDVIFVRCPTPVVDFDADITYGTAPLKVWFKSAVESSAEGCDVEAWVWWFGDGTGSQFENPVHVYESPGIYTVSLCVEVFGGKACETKSGFVVVE